MSGHSKWAKIKRDKASNDAKKGAIFTKLGNQIAIAARTGTDPSTNHALAMVIETAKAFNMPQATIDRAIKRVADKSQQVLEVIVYEGYGALGVAILVETATDNRKRTYPEVKTAFSKHGGSIAEKGSVAFNFKHCGEIIVNKFGDQIMLEILETGAEDIIEHSDGVISIITEARDLHSILAKIRTLDLDIEHASLTYLAQTKVSVDDKAFQKVNKLISALENLDDVINVYTNMELDD